MRRGRRDGEARCGRICTNVRRLAQGPYEHNDIEAFSHDEETHYFDRKSARKDTAEIAKHVMAFANAAGGKLVVGIEDDGTVSGFRRQGAHLVEDFEQVPLTMLSPTPSVACTRVPVVNAKGEPDIVLAMGVEYLDDQVVKRRTDGRVALREGDKSVWLDHEQIRALEYDKGAVRFENAVCEDSTIDDVDREALGAYKRAIGADVSDEQLLRSRHFLKGDRLTNAGVLLFASEPSFILPQARVRVLKVDGAKLGTGEKMNIVKGETFDGPLVKALPAAKDFVASQLRDFQFQQPGGRFATVPEYPEFPWAEGLANAMAHRDYSIAGECTRVYIYDDRMEIQSPGKLPNIVTLENMRHTRYSRNPAIARVFTAFDWVRELNEGVEKIYDTMSEAGLPEPVFSMPNKLSVKLALYNDLANRIPRLQGGIPSFIPLGNGGINEGIKLGDAESEILSLIRSNTSITMREIEEATGFSESKVYRTVRSLREKGIVERSGSRKSGKWTVLA